MLLTEEKIRQILESKKDWMLRDNALVKTFECNDFIDAISFVTKVGMLSEKADHHPNISIHSWNKVELAISTHDEGGITEKDISLLNAIDP
ncbi:MAG: 4a-hydroxytetrahydrobiopterin dehydratase [Melioribacteraceae bacterium]|nr:4a-hydroxytetrahydrobiopterin dehydratase [Melioribacteraceae bacterium]MCF8412856.1 4a-hydroxytetrahydrobiopterin dehydratase [Melioribacteraceae bacterium]MCF8432007.1 4a-hydroxytetrahydrobiopterin dehydratase [Melioribacteraceae bacterium]